MQQHQNQKNNVQKIAEKAKEVDEVVYQATGVGRTVLEAAKQAGNHIPKGLDQVAHGANILAGPLLLAQIPAFISKIDEAVHEQNPTKKAKISIRAILDFMGIVGNTAAFLDGLATIKTVTHTAVKTVGKVATTFFPPQIVGIGMDMWELFKFHSFKREFMRKVPYIESQDIRNRDEYAVNACRYLIENSEKIHRVLTISDEFDIRQEIKRALSRVNKENQQTVQTAADDIQIIVDRLRTRFCLKETTDLLCKISAITGFTITALLIFSTIHRVPLLILAVLNGLFGLALRFRAKKCLPENPFSDI